MGESPYEQTKPTMKTKAPLPPDPFYFFVYFGIIAQNDSKRYTSLEDALLHKGTCEWLDLSKQEIRQLSDSLFLLTKLKYLDLSRTQLQELPMRIGELKELRYLVLSYNQLGNLPDEFSKLQLLQSLYLDHNPDARCCPGYRCLK
jgi:Leucine-rich repeat (LRR) protein